MGFAHTNSYILRIGLRETNFWPTTVIAEQQILKCCHFLVQFFRLVEHDNLQPGTSGHDELKAPYCIREWGPNSSINFSIESFHNLIGVSGQPIWSINRRFC